MAGKNCTIWTTGRNDALAAIYVVDYGDRVIANAEADKITLPQMTKALEKEYLDHTFRRKFVRGITDTFYVQGKRIRARHPRLP